jgi:hypothetical protein
VCGVDYRSLDERLVPKSRRECPIWTLDCREWRRTCLEVCREEELLGAS